MTQIEHKYLLSLSRRVIKKYLSERSVLTLEQESLPSDFLRDKRGVFVTLLLIMSYVVVLAIWNQKNQFIKQ